jgi:murein DD-endopeptidase MepM/ murein hydrolase activator NlpD
MNRGGNTTGKHDDATLNVDSKIANSSIPITRSTSVAKFDNIQFKLTDGSTRTATAWTWANDGGEPLATLGANLTSGGVLNGNIAPAALGKTFKVQVTAVDGTGNIDTRGFTFAPSIGDDKTDIRLISPLPGGIVNSKFGPRLHPIQNVMKPHTGIDMKMADRSVKDVVCSADGEVVLAGGNPSTGYGIRVHVKHITSTGKHLCTTTYNHLNKVYVAVGQKLIAGQKLGLEGTTGSSTGNHLHFEVKLPDGKFIDPEPLINGQLLVAGKTLANGDADPTSLTSQNSGASLSATEVQARQDSCKAFGPAYPVADPAETTDPTPATTDPFELAWYFTMTQEVGSWWMTQPQYSPGDPDVDAGAIETSAQRHKTGYVNAPNFPGGETKFGIAQKPNPRIKVTTVDYVTAKNTGFNNYWQSPKAPCGSKGQLIGIMLFDMNYLHGDGNARKMYQNSGLTSAFTDPYAAQLAQCQVLYEARVAFIKAIPRPEFTQGWLNRAAKCLAYVKSLPPF